MKVVIRVVASVFGLIIAAVVFSATYFRLAFNSLNTGAIMNIDYISGLMLAVCVLILGISLYGLVSAVRIGRQGKS